MVTPEPHAQQTPEPLTDEWVDWLGAVLSDCLVDADVDMIIEYRVTSADGSEFCWNLRLRGGRADVAAGPAEVESGASLVTFTSDRDTARAISAHGESAQRAFLEGRLRLDGDALLLIAARPALEALGAALAPQA